MIPVSSAVDVYTNVENESYENAEMEPIDNFNEIFSQFKCDRASTIVTGIGFIRYIQVDADVGTVIHISGFKWPTNDEPEFSFAVDVEHLIAPMFIGFSIPVFPGYDYVRGIAMGNIEWN